MQMQKLQQRKRHWINALQAKLLRLQKRLKKHGKTINVNWIHKGKNFMNLSNKIKPALWLLTLLVSGCSTLHEYQTPAVKVEQTCPIAPALPLQVTDKETLDYVKEMERLLSNYYSSGTVPTKPSASGSSSLSSTKPTVGSK